MTEIFRVKDQDRIALDFAGSARSYDDDGHLHVKRTPISKATVNEYLGSEIPRGKELGLEPNRRYKLLRDPEELAKAVQTFNNKPLLFDHNPVTADAHDHDRTVGNVSNPEYEHPYLYADLSCWVGPAIKKIDDGSQKEISSAYRYDADMTPGKFESVDYDGVMRNIRCNHVSLVKKGRAGPDVVVLDSAIHGPSPKVKIEMLKNPTVVSALAMGVASQFARGAIAQDAKIDVSPIFDGLTKKNFASRKPLLVLGMKGSLHGLAKDADLAEVEALVDQIEDAVENLADAVDDSPAVEVEPTGEPAATDDDSDVQACIEMCRNLSPEDMAKVMAAMKDMANMPAALPAVDAAKGAPNLTKAPAALDAAPVAVKITGLPKGIVTKPALDAAIEAARSEERERARALREAEAFCRPFSGNLPAMDSAEDVYRATCDVLAIPHQGIKEPAALRAMIEMKGTPNASTPAPKKVAMDSAANAEVAALFPNMNRI
jgi:hypothetical protein